MSKLNEARLCPGYVALEIKRVVGYNNEGCAVVSKYGQESDIYIIEETPGEWPLMGHFVMVPASWWTPAKWKFIPKVDDEEQV